MPLPLTVSRFSKIQISFTFLVPAHLGSPGKGPLSGCVCVCVFADERIFKIDEHLAKLQAKWLIVSYAPFALHFCPRKCRSCQISKITCVLWTETVTSRCYVIGRLMSAYCQQISNCCRSVLTYSLTDWCHQWLTDCWPRTALCVDIFFFVIAVVYSQSLACFYMVVVNIFLLVN